MSRVFQYTSDGDASVVGVTVSRAAMLAQCRTLTSACGYTEGEICVCVVDFKREVGGEDIMTSLSGAVTSLNPREGRV